MDFSEEEWRRLKVDEIYGMYARLDKEIEALKKRVDELEKKLKRAL
jgi:cell division septum initiation protein DivIVA